MLRRTKFALLLCVLSPAAAAAQPVVDWSGPYAGLFAGYAWGEARATAPYDPATGFFYNFTGNSYSADTHALLAGATFGHNWQWGAAVAGLEAEAGYMGLRGSAIDPNGLPGTPDTRTSVRSDFYGAATARLGFATGPALLYVKGGGALLNVKGSTIDPCVAPPAGCGTSTLSMDGRSTRLGWTLGGGVEWALASRWSMKAEYSYFDFGRITTSGPSNTPGELYRQRIDVNAHSARVGVNYRFGDVTPAAGLRK